MRSAALLGLTALLLGLLLPAAGPATAAEAVLSITQPGDRGVRIRSQVSVQGQAPDRPIESARLVGTVEVLVQDGESTRVAVTERVEPVEPSTLNHDDAALPPLPGERNPDFLTSEGGELRGRLTLGCLFQDPGFDADPVPVAALDAPQDECGNPRVRTTRVRLEISYAASADVVTNAVRVDHVRPGLLETALVAPDRVLVRFTEPVRQPGGQTEAPGDYRVEGAEVVRVDGPSAGDCAGRYGPREDASAGDTGCTRTLVLAQPLEEDAEPEVAYVKFNSQLPRESYQDFTGNAFRGATSRLALDLVRPRLPRIEEVDGRPVPAEGRLGGAEERPSVVVSGVTAGHVAYVVAGGVAGPETPAGADRTTLAVPALPGDGTYLLQAVARDTNGNTSLDPGKAPPSADGSPSSVTYVLDRVRPVYDRALLRSESSVDVLFTEAVSGPDRAGDWRVRSVEGEERAVTAVSGSGDRRALTVAGAAPLDLVSYQPASTTDRYRDAGEQVVADATRTLDGIGVPRVETPAGPVLTNAPSAVVAGTADTGRTVRLFRDAGDDGTPDGEPVAAPVVLRDGATRFSFAVSLVEGDNHFLVRADDDTQDGVRSPPADVPTLTLDTDAPDLALSSPAAGAVVRGRASAPVDYENADAHPGPVRIEYSEDDGRTYVVLTEGTRQDPYTWPTPASSTEQARLRLTSTDAAGNAAEPVVSGRFVVDALAPTFEAVTRDPRTVVVTFLSEVAAGRSSGPDWRIAGERASAAAESRDALGRLVVTLTTAAGQALGEDQEPQVEYAPLPLSAEYQDRAGQVVAPREQTARDRIAPAAPTVASPTAETLTAERTASVIGRSVPGGRVRVVDATGALRGQAAVGSDGAWAAEVLLARDAANDLAASAVDVNGNRSLTGTPVPRVEQDSSAPVVTVTEPVSGSRLEPGSTVTVRWTSSDRNLVDRATSVQASTDGGRTYTMLGERLPATGSLTWTVPQLVTSTALLLVTTPDRVGRTGSGVAGPLGIGTAAASPGPSASASASPTPSGSPGPGLPTGPSAPPLPPLGLSVPAGSIVPGELARVVVTGRPGTQVELQAYTRPSTTYRQVRTGVLDADGRASFDVKPGGNTRLFARAAGQPEADSRSAVVTVRTALSLTVVRNARRDYTFQGRILPRRAGQLITLYRVTADGTRVIATQIKTDSTGTYRIRRVFTGSGRFGFLTRTGQTLTNAAGESNGGRPRPTDVF